MNRFHEAGLRALREEMIRKGAPELMTCRCRVDDGTAKGAILVKRHYVAIVTEDRGEDGTAAVIAELNPVLARARVEYGHRDLGPFHPADGPFRTEAPRT